MGKDKKPAPVAAVAAGATTAPVAGAEKKAGKDKAAPATAAPDKSKSKAGKKGKK